METFTGFLREQINPWLLLALGFVFGLTVSLMLANYYVGGLVDELMRTY